MVIDMYNDSYDWNTIKTEYVTTRISYRDIADKYGVPWRTIAHRGKVEKWPELRERNTDKVVTKMIAKEAKKQIDRYQKVLSVTDKLLEKIEDAINIIDGEGINVDKAGVRALSAAIKDIKEIQSLKSDIDRREQEARIKKMEREAEEGNIADDESGRFGVLILPPIEESGADE